MANATETPPITQSDNVEEVQAPHKPATQPRGPSKFQQLNKLYALPAPLRTFPLPTFIPHNPFSLFHILYVWLSQSVQPTPSHLETPYLGWLSLETRSIHVTDTRSIRGLWEQGFYGKGSLSRSEPSWLNRERTRRGDTEKLTSEEITRQRRDERQQTKWERARKEREAIDKTLLEEAKAAIEVPVIGNGELAPLSEPVAGIITPRSGVQSMNGMERRLPPVGPMELLLLPNTWRDLEDQHSGKNGVTPQASQASTNGSPECFETKDLHAVPIAPFESSTFANVAENETTLDSSLAYPQKMEVQQVSNGHGPLSCQNGSTSPSHSETNGDSLEAGSGLGINGNSKDKINGTAHSQEITDLAYVILNGSPVKDSPGTPKTKRQKNVRFSPTVEKNTFLQSEPPSPELAGNGATKWEEEPLAIQDQEHFQLTLEEAFFLSYGLGVLSVLDPSSKLPLSNKDLFSLFRKLSYFPPPAPPAVAPDDPFMISYVVYHHFRSLGWVVRGGTKFSVDFLLYNRGPVFSHAEFGVVIFPSYSDAYWSSDASLRDHVQRKESRSWAWMHCINRVITQVKKTLIVVYVDIPRPFEDADAEGELGVNRILERYKVREIVMKRWLANRSRD